MQSPRHTMYENYFFLDKSYMYARNWASTRDNLSSEFANNKDADQSVHRRTLISAFVIRF